MNKNNSVARIIRECWKHKSKRLDLGACALYTVPAEVWEMEWLEELVLGNNPTPDSNYQVFATDREVYKTLFSSEGFDARDSSGELAPILRFTNNEGQENHFEKEFFSGLKYLVHLKYLNLNRCSLRELNFLQPLKSIDILMIGGNPNLSRFTNYKFRGKIQVKVLDIFGCAGKGKEESLKNIAALINPEHLEYLDMSFNRVSVSGFQKEFLSGCKNLQAVDISYTEEVELAKLLRGHPHLLYLRAEDCKINEFSTGDIPDGLKVLNLGSNRIKKLNVNITQSRIHLKELRWQNSEIENLSFLQVFPQLEQLYISRNKLKSLEGIQFLLGLQVLYSENNLLEDISDLTPLIALRVLMIAGNRLTQITILKDLEELSVLSLSNNHLSDVRELRSLLLKWPHLKSLHLFNNRYKDIDPATLGEHMYSNCLEDVRQHFQLLHKGSKTNEEIKLILVGNSTAGKTTLRKLLRNKKYSEKEDSTHGIVMEYWKIGKQALKGIADMNQLLAQIWDFGGQEYYHETHKLFFSDNAVYIIVWEDKTNKHEILLTDIHEKQSSNPKQSTKKYIEHHSCEYWLKNIRHYAPASPVFLLQNKIDLYTINTPAGKNVRVTRLDVDFLNKFNVHEAGDVSLKKYSQKDPDFVFDYYKFNRQLIQMLAKTIQAFQVNLSYHEIKNAIQEIKHQNVITYAEFEKLCLAIDPDILSAIPQLLRYLINSSVIMYYPRHPALRNKVFVNPVWASEMIYEILDSVVLERGGQFDMVHVNNKFKDRKLAEDFIELMKQLELIFVTESGFIAPQYLPEAAPMRAYSIYKSICGKARLVIHFPGFLPNTIMNGILSQFASSSIDKAYYRYGVVFNSKWLSVPLEQNINIIECDFDQSKIYVYSKSENLYNLREIFEAILSVYSGFMNVPSISTGVDSRSITDQAAENKIAVHLSIDDLNFISWTDLYNRFLSPPDEESRLREDTLVLPTNGDAVIAGLFKAYYMHKGELQSLATMTTTRPQAPNIFISYSHKDEEFRNELLEHLSGLRRSGEINDWTDRAIVPGEKWDEVIRKKLQLADIVIFLISSSFVASDYIHQVEIKQAIERNSRGKLLIVPLPVRDFDYKSVPLKEYQSAAPDFKPIATGYPSRDVGWTQAVGKIRTTIELWKETSPDV